MALVIYTKPGCPYCKKAKDHYNSLGEPFIEYDAQNDMVHRRAMLAFTNGDPTVPTFVKDGKFMGSGWGDPPRG